MAKSRMTILYFLVVAGSLQFTFGGALAEPIRVAMPSKSLTFLNYYLAEKFGLLKNERLEASFPVGKADVHEPEVRLLSYATLGWIDDDRCFNALTEGLFKDVELVDVIANAFADQRRTEALPILYEVYQKVSPWQRRELEEAIRAIHRQLPMPPLWKKDWRLRYRPSGIWSRFGPDWPAIASTLHRSPQWPSMREETPLRSLDEILADEPEHEAGSETCDDCGALMEYHTGVPVCPETALIASIHQVEMLHAWREAGCEDLFDALDYLDYRFREAKDKPEAKARAKREKQLAHLVRLEVERDTCRWLVEQSHEYVSHAKAFLLAQAAALAGRYGDPDGLLQPVETPIRAGKKVGRAAL